MRTCHRHYPGRLDGACSLVYLHRLRPSLCNSRDGSCNCFFEACSAFTHVMACTLAESLYDPLHRKLRQLCCLRRRFDCYRVERNSSRAGIAPAEVQRLFTAHFITTVSNLLFVLGQSDSAKSVDEGGGEMNYQFKMQYHHTEILDRAKKYLEKREK